MPQRAATAAVTIPRCTRCGAGLTHDLYSFLLRGDGGNWPLCLECTQGFLSDLARADQSVLDELEQLWSLE